MFTGFGPENGPSSSHYTRTKKCIQKLYVTKGRRSPAFTLKRYEKCT
jgi:hypothetical protein